MSYSERRFTDHDVTSIIRRAPAGRTTDDRIGYDDLAEIAHQAGIPPEQLEVAVREHQRAQAWEDAKATWRKRRKDAFYDHLRCYLIVNGMLFLVDMFTSGGEWFYWPMLGWGFGLAFDGSDAYFPKEEKVERGARKILKKREMSEMFPE